MERQEKPKKMGKWMRVAAIVGIIFALAGVGFESKYWDRAYPEVTVSGIAVGGLRGEGIRAELENRIPKSGSLILISGVNKWTVGFEEIDLVVDVRQTAAAAMEVGRTGNFGEDLKIRLGIKSEDVTPKFFWDEKKLQEKLTAILGQLNIPAEEPEIKLDEINGLVVVTSGENGQVVNEMVLKQRMKVVVEALNFQPVEIPLTQLLPKLSEEQMEAVRIRASRWIGKKMWVKSEEFGQSWEIPDSMIVGWLDPWYAGKTNEGGFRRDKIEGWVLQLAQTVDRPAQNASFRFMGTGKVEEFKPEQEGVKIMQKETVNEILKVLTEGEWAGSEATVNSLAEKQLPEIKAEDINNLGIHELVGKGESWFTGSITNRIFNLQKAAETLNGVLIGPGETFSFNEKVGEVSAATGYKQAYIIKEGKTILGDGGGVCQVSTTLFRAVLAAGLPIDERTAHAYRVSYYEVKYQVGFDATVFQPAPDFKFRNDTPGHLLIQTVYDEKNKYLAFELYGTSDGRVAEISKARVWEVTPPPPDLYIDDPTLPIGQVKQTEHAAPGAKVAFDWKVTRDGEVIIERTFFSNYRSWQGVYLRGTKTN